MLNDSLLAVTAAVLAVGMLQGYRRTRDILHPMLFLGPLFLYGTVIDPWLVRHDLDRFFRNQQDVPLVLLLDLLCVAALTLGVLHSDGRVRRVVPSRGTALSDEERIQLKRISALLGLVALAAYSYGILNVGGFVAAFSRAKGGGSAGSGYIGEAMNLGLVAVVMVALSQYRRSWTAGTLVVLGLGLLPNLVQGTFGGRRGPLFLAVTGLAVAWLITRRRIPGVWTVASSLLVAVLSVTLVWSQRQSLYLGSDAQVDWGSFRSTLAQAEIDQGNNFIYGAGFVVTTRYSGQFTWGRELAVNLLVRPIPRQLWPTKYEDVGATWVTNSYPGLGPMTHLDWLSAVGWLPLAGSSAISITDLFGDFGWGAILVMYLVGRGFGLLRTRRISHGGVWTLLYLEFLILSIYLATQSFSAFYHRYLILAVPTLIAWNVFVARRARPRGRRVRVLQGRVATGSIAR